MYHDVVAADERERVGFVGAASGRYKLAPESFGAHLDAIAAAGPAPALTFDDGGASSPQIATALEQRGWRGHFFVTTERVGTPGFLDQAGVRELVARGHDVGSHSHTHPTYMGTLSEREIAREWDRSRRALSEILGRAPTSASVPGGFVSPPVIEQAALAGYELLMTSKPTSAVLHHHNWVVRGRFTIWSVTSPAQAAAYARGDRIACAKLRLAWQLKQAPKRLNPRAYETLRLAWAERHPASGPTVRPR
jgi:peptidoglycan/xylan/chitin deacetylase (PgdA/CDA1 family)